MLKLKVGGKKFETSRETLCGPYFERMFSDTIEPGTKDKGGYVCIDRDGRLFRHLLNYMRNRDRYVPPTNVDVGGLMNEAIFFGLDGLVDILKGYLTVHAFEIELDLNNAGLAFRAYRSTSEFAWLEKDLNELIESDKSRTLKKTTAWLSCRILKLASRHGYRLASQYQQTTTDELELHLIFMFDRALYTENRARELAAR